MSYIVPIISYGTVLYRLAVAAVYFNNPQPHTSTLVLLRRYTLQRLLERIHQLCRIFQPHAKANQLSVNPPFGTLGQSQHIHNTTTSKLQLTYPVQLPVVRQNDVWRTQREVRPQTWTLDGVQVIEKRNRVFFRVKRSGEKPSIAAVGVATFVIPCACWTCFWVVDLLDCCGRLAPEIDIVHRTF
jgi:hypothetical protein